MKDVDTIPEFECFDCRHCPLRRGCTGRPACIPGPLEYNFVMGVASGDAGRSGIAADPAQTESSGSALAGHRDRAGDRKSGRCISAALIWAVTCAPARRHLLSARRRQGDLERTVNRKHRACARRAGREIASPAEARADFWNQALRILSRDRSGRVLVTSPTRGEGEHCRC